MTIKYLSLYYAIIKVLNNNDSLIFNLLIINVYSSKRKYIIRNKVSPIMTVKSLSSYYITIKKPNSNNFLFLFFW